MGKDINLLGRDWLVKPIPQFAVREELVMAFAENHSTPTRLNRVAAAAIGLATDIGPASKADYRKAGFDVLAYGGAVYGYLREKGASQVDVLNAGVPILADLTAALFPREDEVKDLADFTEAGEGG